MKRSSGSTKRNSADFGSVLYEVRNDWLTGLVRLKEYRVLFSDDDAVKLLNAAGGAFMWDVQQILWHDLLLHVTRLTDPATMGGHENLSVRALPPFCERPELQAEYPELQAEVQTLVDRAVTAADALGIPVKWNSVSGDLEHGFRRSGTLVGA